MFVYGDRYWIRLWHCHRHRIRSVYMHDLLDGDGKRLRYRYCHRSIDWDVQMFLDCHRDWPVHMDDLLHGYGIRFRHWHLHGVFDMNRYGNWYMLSDRYCYGYWDRMWHWLRNRHMH